MRLINVVTKVIVIVTIAFTFVACDDDFNSIGSQVLGDVNFEDKQYITDPVAFSKKFEKVQTNNLVSTTDAQVGFHANMLGVYSDPVYGESTYSILSQVLPVATSFPINFGTSPVLDSIVLDVPYFSTSTGTSQVQVTLEDNTTVTETANTYSLDSIYGNQPIKLSIFRSNYFLRDADPTTENSQIYYSDDLDRFGATELESDELYVNNSFTPSALETVLTSPDGTDADTNRDRTRVAPRLRVKLPVDKFKTSFLDQEGSPELSNTNNFLNYFRGIYFKVEPIGSGGTLMYLNLRGGTLTLHYTSVTTSVDDGQTVEQRTPASLELSFANNIVNSINRTPLAVTPGGLDIETELLPANQDMVNGETNLYLKGGNGSFAVLDFFNRYVQTNGNGDFVLDENGGPIFIPTPNTPTANDKTELDFLRDQQWLVNEASFKIYINQGDIVSGEVEPERIYIFNLETGQPLLDHANDLTASTDSPVNSRREHLGRISRGSDNKGEFYEINLTQYIINLLNNEDVTNAKLGLSVSQNVNIITQVLGDTPEKNNEIIPTSSIISHEGTILYGNTDDVPESKRLKLDIFYTAPKDN